jgi:hypothetical protein
MLTTTSRQTRETIGEWRRRPRSRRELAMLDEVDRHEPGQPGNLPRHQDDEGDHHRQMFANLAATAWVGTLMTSAYYVFSTLLTAAPHCFGSICHLSGA